MLKVEKITFVKIYLRGRAKIEAFIPTKHMNINLNHCLISSIFFGFQHEFKQCVPNEQSSICFIDKYTITWKKSILYPWRLILHTNKKPH